MMRERGRGGESVIATLQKMILIFKQAATATYESCAANWISDVCMRKKEVFILFSSILFYLISLHFFHSI